MKRGCRIKTNSEIREKQPGDPKKGCSVAAFALMVVGVWFLSDIPSDSYYFIYGYNPLSTTLFGHSKEERDRGNTWRGNCYGMSTTAGLFNSNIDGVAITSASPIPEAESAAAFCSALNAVVEIFAAACSVVSPFSTAVTIFKLFDPLIPRFLSCKFIEE